MYLFFDVDDTLLDTISGRNKAVADLVRLYPEKLGTDIQAFDALWRTIADSYYAQWVNGKLTLPEIQRARIRYFFGQHLSNEDADKLFNLYITLNAKHWVPFPDVLPSLSQLNEYPMAVLTNGEPNQQRRKLRTFGIENCFEMIITPGEAGASKPDERIFRYAAKRANLQAKDCIYIGDQLDLDARAACHAGWQGIWLDRFATIHDIVDVPVIRTLNELPLLLGSIPKED
jgi:putative hydrolase of the HAD superfamily